MIIFLIVTICCLILIVLGLKHNETEIEKEIQAKGWKLISKEWSPFGNGFPSRYETTYKVIYKDKYDNTHEVFLTVSNNFGGVRDFKDNRIIAYSNEPEKGPVYNDNIQNDSQIEYDLTIFIQSKDRKRSSFDYFIRRHYLQKENRFLDFECHFILEDWMTGSTPEIRICLLFKESKLQGILHSREIKLADCKTSKVVGNYKATFFNDYPESKQHEYLDFMKNWFSEIQ